MILQWNQTSEPHIILLTGEVEGPFLTEILREHKESLTVTHVQSREELEDVYKSTVNSTTLRLIGFCTSIIVPAKVIRALTGLAYNFHPGPPSYPGVNAANFALYNGEQRFGVTAHMMCEKVDTGPIVGVDWFEIPEQFNHLALETKAFSALLQLFRQLSPLLVEIQTPLPETNEQWSGQVTTRKDFEHLTAPLTGMSDEEIRRRKRAFG